MSCPAGEPMLLDVTEPAISIKPMFSMNIVKQTIGMGGISDSLQVFLLFFYLNSYSKSLHHVFTQQQVILLTIYSFLLNYEYS